MKKKIAFVVSAYNEEKNIKKVILQFKKIGTVLVINDNSKDKTGTIASKYSDYVINNKYNEGYDKSLRIGLKYVVNNIKKAEIIFTIDGDGQHSSKNVNKFLKKIDYCDAVIGQRQYYNRYSEHIVGFFSKFFDNISDPLCGIKCFKRFFLIKLLKDIKQNSDYVGMFFLRKKAKILQVNVNVKKNKYTSFGSGWRANYRIILAYIKIKAKII